MSVEEFRENVVKYNIQLSDLEKITRWICSSARHGLGDRSNLEKVRISGYMKKLFQATDNLAKAWA